MDRYEVVKLLALAMAYDNRNTGEAIVNAWDDAARRQHWTFPAAVEAIKQHYSESTEFVRPGHITARIRAMRPLDGDARRQIEDRSPASEQQRAEALESIYARFGWERRYDADRDGEPRLALSIACPHCHASAGCECRQTEKGTGRFLPLIDSDAHPSRVAAAEKAHDQDESTADGRETHDE